VDRFVAAMPLVLKQIPDAQFLIVGKGDEEKNIRRQLRELNIESRVCMKQVSWKATVYEVLEGIDIFVMPSKREGCPVALLEALSLARPVIASDIPGIRDILKNGENGLLVDMDNSASLTEKIVFLCCHADKAVIMGKNGLSRVNNYFTIEAEMKKFNDLYLGLLRA
jgi:glycosyltransferase involved in cell wall biosynthesis